MIIPVSRRRSDPPRDDFGTLFYKLIASPDLTAPVHNKATSDLPFNSSTFFVPSRGAVDSKVGFYTSEVPSPPSIRTYGFVAGLRTMVVENKQLLPAVFCAFPTENPGIWSIMWNQTADVPGGVAVEFRGHMMEQENWKPGTRTTMFGTKCRTIA
jgi:hypothetical protein